MPVRNVSMRDSERKIMIGFTLSTSINGAPSVHRCERMVTMGRLPEGVQQHLCDHESCERYDRACGWTERGDDQSARRCDSSICVEDHRVNMH
jgi:hypothetical protein